MNLKKQITISKFVLFPYSNNTVLNLILNEKKIFAEQHGILYKCTVEQTDFRFMDDIDITTIFSNLLENALSASALCKTNKEVSVIISSHSLLKTMELVFTMLKIVLRNMKVS